MVAERRVEADAGQSPWRIASQQLRRNRAAFGGLVVVLTMSVVAALHPWIEAHILRFRVTENHACLRYQPPGIRGVPREFARFSPVDAAGFSALDSDGDGAVSASEWSRGVMEVEFAWLDRDGDGVLNVVELAQAPRTMLYDDYERVLGSMDSDRSGGLDVSEAQSVVDIFPLSESTALLRRYDADGDLLLGSAELPGVPIPQTFFLGTDGLGRDVAGRLVYGARISLLVGLLATTVSLVIGVAWGALAGFVGGRVDALMMRIVDVLYGLPFMFLVILLMVMFGRNILLLFAAIGAVSWLTMARIVRGQVLSLRNQEFVLAARALGLKRWRIVVGHVLPNALGPIIVYATLTVPAVMLQEAFLSFLGLGVQPPYTSWGAMANDGASAGVMLNYPWLILAPGLALALTLVSLNFLGDGLRDALDPRTHKD